MIGCHARQVYGRSLLPPLHPVTSPAATHLGAVETHLGGAHFRNCNPPSAGDRALGR